MENIALSFSGGGFRAACFSLGSLSYLNKIKYKGKALLENVKFISSTSGGSITNLVYSSYVFSGKSFNDCYVYLFSQLEGEKLIDHAINILDHSEEWKNRPFKSRNLINAFSIAYDELLNKETLGLFTNRINHPHLEEICVNSTEFTNGLPFRFQSQHPDPGFSRGKIGNAFISFNSRSIAVAAKLKLADILASSSCFPSGFEPMIFPDDYSYNQLTNEELRNAINFKANAFTIKGPAPVNAPGGTDQKAGINAKYERLDLLADKEFNKDLQFGIMDGGVADNQAIDAFKLADDRRKGKDLPGFDLFIACDVTSFFMDGYTLPLEKKKWYNKISFLAIIVAWIAAILVFPGLLLFVRGNWKAWMYVVSTISVLMSLPVLYFLYIYISKIFSKKKESTWNAMLNKYIGKFLKLRIGVLKQMLASRIKSVFILANDIYLKQIRRMYYDGLFDDERYKDRIIQNAIYDLSKAKFNGNDTSAETLRPSAKMIEVAEKARTMGTTLWFDSKHRNDKIKECIIATGRFTTCFNLLKYLSKKEENTLSQEMKQLKKDLTADWEKFGADPFHELVIV